jgi:hypothetical protein
MAAAAEMVETFLAQKAAEALSASPAKSAKAVLTQPETPPAAEIPAAEEAAVQNAPQDADAHDEAVLDMIAMEMGAPDPISDDEIAEAMAEQARRTARKAEERTLVDSFDPAALGVFADSQIPVGASQRDVARAAMEAEHASTSSAVIVRTSQRSSGDRNSSARSSDSRVSASSPPP